MKVGKSFKVSFPDGQGGFHSRGFFIDVEHHELGLADPQDKESAIQIASALSLEVEGMCLIEKYKCGLVAGNQISESLQPWITQTSTSSS